jgi:hypothetical protein
MLTIETHEMTIANSFLKLLGADMSAIEFICKDKTYYNTKTKEELKDILSHILLKHPLISDIHLSKDINGINIRIRSAGRLINLNAICLSANNYKTIEIDGITFLNTYFNRHIKNILNTQHLQDDFLDNINVPLCGSYRLRSATIGKEATIRLLKVNSFLDNETMNSNVLYLQDNPYYIIDIANLDSFIGDNVIKLNDNIKYQLQLYKTTIKKLFHHLIRVTENIYLYTESDFKLKLQHQDNEEIQATILKNYNFSTNEKNVVLDYLLENYEVFYNPIFSYFIESCVRLENDGTTSEFKSAEAFKDYLTVIKMLKI